MHEEPTARLLKLWAETEVKFCPGLSDARLDAWEAEQQVRLPPELRSLYRATNGIKDGTTDAHLLHFWPLEEAESLETFQWHPPGLSGWEQWYVFADTFIDAYHLAVALGTNDDWGRVAWVCGDTHVDLARTFPEFLELYLRDPDAVIDGVEPILTSPPAT